MLTARHINKLQDDVITVTRLLKNLHQELEHLKADVVATPTRQDRPDFQSGVLVMVPDPGNWPFWTPAVISGRRRRSAADGRITEYLVSYSNPLGIRPTEGWVPAEHIHAITTVQSSES